jgi:hypothetical protein
MRKIAGLFEAVPRKMAQCRSGECFNASINQRRGDPLQHRSGADYMPV